MSSQKIIHQIEIGGPEWSSCTAMIFSLKYTLPKNHDFHDSWSTIVPQLMDNLFEFMSLPRPHFQENLEVIFNTLYMQTLEAKPLYK